MCVSVCGEDFDGRKEESGPTLSRCFVRLYEDSCRFEGALRQSSDWLLRPETSSVMGRRINRASIAVVVGR